MNTAAGKQVVKQTAKCYQCASHSYPACVADFGGRGGTFGSLPEDSVSFEVFRELSLQIRLFFTVCRFAENIPGGEGAGTPLFVHNSRTIFTNKLFDFTKHDRKLKHYSKLSKESHF
jgi:hypothetical protein